MRQDCFHLLKVLAIYGWMQKVPELHEPFSRTPSKKCFGLQESDASSQVADAARLKEVISRCGALASERPKSLFSAKDLETDLARLLKGGNIEQHRDVLERPLAASALAGDQSPCSPLPALLMGMLRQGFWSCNATDHVSPCSKKTEGFAPNLTMFEWNRVRWLRTARLQEHVYGDQNCH